MPAEAFRGQGIPLKYIIRQKPCEEEPLHKALFAKTMM
jgi:hypothetical protein